MLARVVASAFVFVFVAGWVGRRRNLKGEGERKSGTAFYRVRLRILLFMTLLRVADRRYGKKGKCEN